MRPRTSRLMLLSIAALLSACGPPESENANDPFAQHNKQLQRMDQSSGMTFRPPPEIARTLGLETTDSRQEIVFLQSQATLPFQGYQKYALNTLVGRQQGRRLVALDAAGKAATQLQQLREALARKPLAIILDPVEGGEFDGSLAEAVQAGILVIGLDKHLTACTTIVHTSPASIGRTAGEVVIEALKRKAAEEGKSEIGGRVVQLRLSEGSVASSGISSGFTAALKAQPGVILVHDAPADGQPGEIHQRIAEAVRIQQQFDVIFAHSDAIARQASLYVSGTGLRENLLIVGVDALPVKDGGLQLLRDTEIDVTIARPPLVDLALQIITKAKSDPTFKPLPEYEIPPLAVTPKNHAEVTRKGSYSLPQL